MKVKITQSEWMNLKQQLKVSPEGNSYIYKGKEVYLYDELDISYMMSYVIQKEYGNSLVIELDSEDSDLDFSQLSRVGIFESGSRIPTEDALTNRILIVDASKYFQSNGSESILINDIDSKLLREIEDLYKQILGNGYSDEMRVSYCPRYVYFEGLESHKLFAAIESKLAYSELSIIPVYFGIGNVSRGRKISASSFKEIEDKFGKALLITNKEDIKAKDKGLYEECRKLYYDMKLALEKTVCVDMDVVVKEPMMATLAGLAASTDKRVIFMNVLYDEKLADALVDLTSGKIGTIYDRIMRSFSLGKPGSLRVVVKDALDSLNLCKINGVKQSLKFSVCKLSDIMNSMVHSEKGWNINPGVSSIDKVETLNEEQVNLFEIDDDGKLIYVLRDPLTLLTDSDLDDLEQQWYYICRCIDQYCVDYREFTTLRDVIVFDANGETYIGYGDYKATYLCDVFVLDEEGNYIRDLEVENIFDSRFLYDAKTVDGEYTDEFLDRIQDILEKYKVEEEPVDDPDNKLNISDVLHYIWYVTSEKYNNDVELVDSLKRRLYMYDNYHCYRYYLRVLFSIITPYGFRDIAYKDSIVNIYGGMVPGATKIYPDFFRHVPEM